MTSVARPRTLERRYRRTLRVDDHLAWICQVRCMHSLYEKKEEQYWTCHITSCRRYPRQLWQSMSSLLRFDKSLSSITADKLAQFFADKVAAVHAETKDAAPPMFTQHRGPQLLSFSELSADDV